jgi:hypothetical protein
MDVVNAALTFTWMFPDNALFASPFGIQLEVLFNYDFSEHFDNMSLAFSAGLRTHLYRRGTTAITLLTSAYYAFAPFQDNNSFTSDGVGITGGLNIGNKLGAGYLYLELRWMGDLFFDTYIGDENDKRYLTGFKRHMAGLCIGYEFGIINKK